MSNLLQRIITGVLGAAGMLTAIWFSFETFALIFFIATVFSSIEYHQLLKKSGIATNALAGIIGSVGIYLLFVLNAHKQLVPTSILLGATCVLFMIYMLIELFSVNEQPLTRIAYTIFGIMYVSVPFGLLTLIPWNYNALTFAGTPVYQFEIIFAILFLIWANDVGAYFVGKFLGKHKLFERISPKKTWEGSVGGLLTAILFTYLLYTYFGLFSVPKWMGLCVVTVISGSLGDLVESMIKRTLNVKDSGTLLPGHGGFLDRFDALIFAIPFIYLYLSLTA
jgi:phosphatidate cytidylyltransferase